MHRIQRAFGLLLVFVLVFTAAPTPAQTQAPEQGAGAQAPRTQYNTVLFTFPAGGDDGQLGVAATLEAALQSGDASSQLVPDQQPDGPQALVYEQGVFSILDTLNGRVLQWSQLGGQQAAFALPEGYFADMRSDGSDLVLNNPSENAVVRVPAGASFDGARGVEALDAETAEQFFHRDGSSAASTFDTAADVERVDERHQRLVVFDREGVMLATLMVETQHFLGSARYLGQDSLGNYYVMVEEVLEGIEAIVAETTVRRYSPDGLLLDAALLPLEELYFLPTRPVAIDPAGGAYFLLVRSDAAQVLRLGFNPTYTSRLEERWQEIAASETFLALTALSEEPTAALTAASPITRQQVIQAAAAYTRVGWTLSPANYYTGQAGNYNNCSDDKTRRENWRLPRYLTNRVNQVIQEVPYTWGGYQSIDSFRTRLSQGNWAGNICGREVRNNVAGVDCSGYVSVVLQLGGHYTTRTMVPLFYRIRWDELRPGDILLKDSHVMIFDKFDNGRNTDGGVWIYESTMRSAWDRVIYSKVDFSYLTSYGYAPWRAKNIVEDGPPVRSNMIRNGTFAAGLDQWSVWGEAGVSARDGALYMHRLNPSPNAAVLYQDLNYPMDAGSPVELTFSLGNISPVDKPFYVTLHAADTWNGALSCSFNAPANSDLRNYRMAAKLPARWANTRFELSIVPADGQPSLVMDNFSTEYRPDLNPIGVECAVQEPTPAYNMILDHYLTGSGWVKTDTENPVHCSQNQGNLYYNRTNRGGDAGAAHWWINVPSDGYYEVFAYMPNYGHYMAVTPHARYWVEYEGMPAGGPSQLVVLNQNNNLCQWVSLGTYRYIPGKSYGVYMGVGNIPYDVAVPNLIAADRVMVVPVGNPDRTPPDGTLTSPANGAVINRAVPKTTVTLAANAWDASSGVGRVEFHVRYDGTWHSIGTDTTAPYGMTWTIPANIAPQTLDFTIHVIDRTGNETIDPGGYRSVTYKMAYRSSGFNLATNGYSFQNYGDTNILDFTLTDLVNMLGKEQACSLVLAGVCVSVKQEVVAKHRDISAGMQGGHCQGFSVSSLRFFRAIDLPSAYQLGASTTSDLSKLNLQVRRNIAWYQARQSFTPIKSYWKPGSFETPVVELYRLYDTISANAVDQQVLVIYHQSFTMGHAVTPYAIEDRGAGVYWIRIYDNNYPGDTSLYVEVNTKTNTWNYAKSGTGWSGDAKNRTLGTVHISLFTQPAGMSTNGSERSWAATLPDGSPAVELHVNGTNQVLVSDASGRKLGYENGQFVDEIPESSWVIYPGSTTTPTSPDIILPADLSYQVSVGAPAGGASLNADGSAVPITLTRYGPGFTASVDQLNPGEGTSDTVALGADGSAVVFIPGSNASRPTLTLAQDSSGSSIKVTVANAGSASGQPVLFTEQGGRYKLDYSQAGQGLYHVEIERFVNGDAQLFNHEQVTIRSGDIHYLDITNWDGNGDLTLEVDQGGDGDIDQEIDLDNEQYKVFLPNVLH